jgi:hypothetical protein
LGPHSRRVEVVVTIEKYELLLPFKPFSVCQKFGQAEFELKKQKIPKNQG